MRNIFLAVFAVLIAASVAMAHPTKSKAANTAPKKATSASFWTPDQSSYVNGYDNLFTGLEDVKVINWRKGEVEVQIPIAHPQKSFAPDYWQFNVRQFYVEKDKWIVAPQAIDEFRVPARRVGQYYVLTVKLWDNHEIYRLRVWGVHPGETDDLLHWYFQDRNGRYAYPDSAGNIGADYIIHTRLHQMKTLDRNAKPDQVGQK